MKAHRFDPRKLEKLNNPLRLKELPVKKIIKLANIDSPKVIIDLGAGTGFFSIPFSKINKQCKIYACDVSGVMIDWMHQNVVAKYKNIIPLKMKNNLVPLNDNIADFLFMINLHHELDNPDKTLQESYRLLKPEGKIAISDWKKEKTEHGPPVEIRYDPDVIKKQLSAAGFIRIRIYTGFINNFLIIADKYK